MMSSSTLLINEIFYSIQGESSCTGKPCIFIRLTACNLRCKYCDTEYAFYEGEEMTFDEIEKNIAQYKCNLVEITGGEPLLQENVYQLMSLLCDKKYQVLLETGGHMDISRIDDRVKIIMDIKCPSSGEMDKNRWDNLHFLKKKDEIKFVIMRRKDFDWATRVISEYKITNICPVIFSPVFGKMNNEDLAEWILVSNLDVRMQLQLHKYIWDPNKRGV